MIEFRDGFYADVRTEDRSRTVISYQAGILEEMKARWSAAPSCGFMTAKCGITPP